LTLRGDHAAAIAAFEAILERCRSVEPSLSWPTFRACAAYAQALNAVGQHERAKRHATETITRGGADVQRFVVHYLEPQRQLALAEAGLGHHSEATRILDELLAEHGAEDQPLLLGLLHKARAEVALAMDDSVAFHSHLAEVARCVRLSQNPVLMAQFREMATVEGGGRTAVGERPGQESGSQLPRVVSSRGADLTDAVGALRDITLPSDRAANALSLVVGELGARSGFLYVVEGDGDERIELAAASSQVGPPRELELALRDVVGEAQRVLGDDEEEDYDTATLSAIPSTSTRCEDGQRSHQLAVLRTSTDFTVVGGLILELDGPQCLVVETQLLSAIADALRD
jgi:hypothetical protein